MIRTDKSMRLCTTLLICNLVFIWGNSLLPGRVSGMISDQVKELLDQFLPDGGASDPEGGLLRKAAHFLEFTALGMCLTWRGGMLGKSKLRPLAFGVGAACVDETIQRFVPERCSSLRDVAIDSCGVLTGMILIWFGHTLLARKRTEKP